MARALRPVVVLMLFATLLFVAAGALDGVFPGGAAWPAGEPALDARLAWSSYAFALVNLGFALVIARGSERSLVGRIGLSLFFVIERTVSAFALGPKSPASVGVHLTTAIVELAILSGSYRVWRLGQSVGAGDLAGLFAIAGAPILVPAPSVPPGSPGADPPPDLAARPVAQAWLLGPLALALAGLLVGDGIRLGYLPGVRDWAGVVGSPAGPGELAWLGWLGYLLAAAVLVLAARAARSARRGVLALRLLLALAILAFLERSIGPFALYLRDPISLMLHGLGAFAALALALASASAIRDAGRPSDRAVLPG